MSRKVEKPYIVCQVCKNGFYVNPCEIRKAEQRGMRRAFCGRECYGKFLSEHQRGEKNHHWKDNSKACLVCADKFKPKSRKTKFCSSKCWGQKKHEERSIKKNCVICAKSFNVKLANSEISVCCSQICASKLHSQRMMANGNSNWRGGIGKLPYSYEFTQQLKDRIRNRDKYVCQQCGKREEQEVAEINQRLVIHHIDYDKMNCSESNLIAVCNICNVKANYGRENWKQFYQKMMYGKVYSQVNSEHRTYRAVCV